MGEYVIVANGRDDGDDEVIRRVVIIVVGAGEDLPELVDDQLVEVLDLLVAAGVFLVVVVAGRIAGPDDEVNVIADVVADPIEGGIHKGQRRVASRCLCAVVTCRAMSAMAGAVS